LPQEKEQTRWEEFADQKGIKKRKRERMIYDESDGKWKPNWGYKSKKNEEEGDWAIEMKQNAPEDINPWSERRKEKKQNVAQNEKNRGKNQERAVSARSKKKDGRDVPVGIPLDINNKKGKAKKGQSDPDSRMRGKSNNLKALGVVQRATASMGKFDSIRKGEPTRVSAETKERKRKKSLPKQLGSERKRDLEMLSKMFKK